MAALNTFIKLTGPDATPPVVTGPESGVEVTHHATEEEQAAVIEEQAARAEEEEEDEQQKALDVPPADKMVKGKTQK